jgi:outer membrane protein
MKANKFALLLGILIPLAFATHAQERSLSLQEAIELSLTNNKQIKLNAARIYEATAKLKGARENRLPEFSISGAYMRLNQPTVDLKMNLAGSGNSDTAARSSSSVEVKEAMYGIANLSLPLFAGFKIQAGIESAKYLAAAAKLDAEVNREEVIQNTISAYSNLYKAGQAVQLVQENLKSSKQRVADFSNLEKNGLLARNDLLKVQLQESNIELSLLDAESNVKIATVNMNLMLGLPEETLLTTDNSSLISQQGDIKTLADWETDALQYRKDIAALAAREKAAHAGIRYAKSDYYPSLALTGGYIAAYVPNVITISNAVNAGVGFKYAPSSLWKNGSKVAEAKSRLLQIQINQSSLDDQVRMQINQNYQNYVLSLRKIEVYNKAVAQAAENYRITKNKYDNSLANTTDLLDADVAQLQAKLNYAYSKADAAVAYNKLLQAAGLLNSTSK